MSSRPQRSRRAPKRYLEEALRDATFKDESCDEVDSDDEKMVLDDEENELDEVMSQISEDDEEGPRTKHGYLADGFIVDSDEDELSIVTDDEAEYTPGAEGDSAEEDHDYESDVSGDSADSDDSECSDDSGSVGSSDYEEKRADSE